jgi:hypothetical protein
MVGSVLFVFGYHVLYFRFLYGIQLWGSAAKSHLESLERFQSKVLRILTDAPWFVPNAVV